MTDGLLLRSSVALFDCDGVLVDSDASVISAWSRWARRYGLSPEAVVPLVHGRRSADTVEALIAPDDRAEALATINAFELEDAATVTAVPGAVELVASMPSDAWAVVTSGTTALATARLRAAGFDQPAVLVTADDVSLGKPDPEGYLAAARALGVAPGDVVVLEDSAGGVLAARRAGAGHVIGVSGRPAESSPDVLVLDLTALKWTAEGMRVTSRLPVVATTPSYARAATGRRTDVKVTSAGVSFRVVPFATPLHLSTGPITALTEARVSVRVLRRDGRFGEGCGSVLLSYPWAGGSDEGMRFATGRLLDAVVSYDYADPMQHGARLLDALDALPGPRLAAEVALGPIDQAVHDAWARAEGRSAYTMYNDDFLGADLGEYLGPDFAGRWPTEWLSSAPAGRLPVQYVLGVSEPIASAAGRAWLKVKLSGKVKDDIARVREVAALGAQISLDPNEAYTSREDLAELLRATDAVYVEQPVPRGDVGPGPGSIPLLADEGLPDPRRLDSLEGWDGIVVKTCRGQTAALLAYCWARHRERFVVQQDLTHVGAALAHAATFAAHCTYSVRAFECNSLQFAPAGNTELAAERPGLVSEHEGFVEVSASGLGIR